MVETLKDLIPNFSHFEEQPLSINGTYIIGYQSVLITKSGFPYAGGTARELNQARRVCAAEAIERAHFALLLESSTSVHDQFKLSTHPTTCGFAAGFDERATIYRAICEAVERWAWSKWIDTGLQVPQVEPVVDGDLKKLYSSVFEDLSFYQQEVFLNDSLKPSFVPNRLVFSAVIGRKGSGIFPGSRVTTSKDDCWEHPLLEAWRHHNIFTHELTDKAPTNLFDRRILHFGQHGTHVLEQIKCLQQQPWAPATLCLVKEVAARQSYFVWRALCHDFVGWEHGDEFRFIY